MAVFRVPHIFFLFVVLLSHILGVNPALGQAQDRKRVLVFGGNGFIGSEVVSNIIERDQYDITTVNRGNWYFDSKERIMPYVKNIICDRDKAFKLECPELLKSGAYDIVIDFSSYTAKQIQQVVDILKDRVGLYIYISSDSIYEVCQKDHVAPTKEEDAVRPKSAKKRMQLRKTETYGHEKLACEEVLVKQRKAGGFPYVALRLPDVIGPRDGSFRFWIYQLWINTHNTIDERVPLPKGVSDTKFSLVHVEDVAKAVLRVLEVGHKAYDQPINIAFDKHFTLESLLADIGRQLGLDKVQFLSDVDQTWYTYPTVTKGPLDINRAKILLDWEPMPWDRGLAALVTFFDDAMTDKSLASEREMVIADVIENLVPEEKYAKYLEGLKKVYGKEVFDGLDLNVGFARDALEIESANRTDNDNTTHVSSVEDKAAATSNDEDNKGGKSTISLDDVEISSDDDDMLPTNDKNNVNNNEETLEPIDNAEITSENPTNEEL